MNDSLRHSLEIDICILHVAAHHQTDVFYKGPHSVLKHLLSVSPTWDSCWAVCANSEEEDMALAF